MRLSPPQVPDFNFEDLLLSPPQSNKFSMTKTGPGKHSDELPPNRDKMLNVFPVTEKNNYEGHCITKTIVEISAINLNDPYISLNCSEKFPLQIRRQLQREPRKQIQTKLCKICQVKLPVFTIM